MAQVDFHIPGSKLLLFGGVYSNLQALEDLRAWAHFNNYAPEEILCSGDIIGYCAQPRECIELMRVWNVQSIAGNVEIQLRNEEDDCGCNFNENSLCDIYSKQWYPFSQGKITEEDRQWMRGLPESAVVHFGGKRWGLVHGSSSETSKFVYKSTPWAEKQAEMDLLGVDHILAGHCGIPCFDSKNGRAWINSGALGMPANDGTPRVWFCTIKHVGSNFEVQFHALEYDRETTDSLIRKNNLPEVYAKTLQTGLWDSTEVLRTEEAALTGVRIALDADVFEV